MAKNRRQARKIMDEVISSILEAEKKADSLVVEAQDNAKKAVLAADTEGERIKANAVESFKIHRKAALADAEKRGETEYAKIIARGEKRAKEVEAAARDNIETAADAVVKEILK